MSAQRERSTVIASHVVAQRCERIGWFGSINMLSTKRGAQRTLKGARQGSNICGKDEVRRREKQLISPAMQFVMGVWSGNRVRNAAKTVLKHITTTIQNRSK